MKRRTVRNSQQIYRNMKFPTTESSLLVSYMQNHYPGNNTNMRIHCFPKKDIYNNLNDYEHT